MADTLSQNLSGELSQNTSQTQKLKLSAHQLHSVQLLESSMTDLEASLRTLVDSNPLLELAEPGEEAPVPEEKSSEEDDFSLSDDGEEEYSIDEDAPSSPLSRETLSPEPGPETEKDWDEHLQELAQDPENWGEGFFPSGDEQTENASPGREDPREYFFDNLTKEQNLKDVLMEELSFADAAENVRRAAECIIGSLEENGYFTDALTDVAQTANVTLPEAEEALALVQSFDPPGVAASSLSECLLLQLKRKKNKDRLLEKLVKDHLEDVGKNRLPRVAEKLNIGMEKLSSLLEKLKKLDPCPGIRFNPEKNNRIVPDVIVEEDENGEYTVSLNDRSMPRLYFSHAYDDLMNSPRLTPEEKNYFREKTTEGKLAIYELEHRSSTILRIARLIVSEQYEFFKHGGSALKPMTMHQAADKLGVDDSTVSRGCNQKYMLTPRGLFEFKYFFSTGFTSQSGEEASSRALMEMIREMIEEEDPSRPLSDDALSKLLKEKGYSVARRTVMKYRENMKIPSSQGRRKHI